jgi:putative ABC transport system ATP-binding protein
MVTHSMQQALELGTRILMMHNGKVIEDIPEEAKRNLTTEDLLNKFEDIRKLEKLTPEIIEQLRNQYR